MSEPKSSSEWADRRGMFQRGKESHTPSSPTVKKFHETGAITNAVRRASVTSNGGGSPIEKTSTNGSAGIPTASGRRRSSAGMFGNLTTQKRGSEDYGERRASQTEMIGGGGGVFSGWYNSTFRGIQKPAGTEPKQDQK